MRRPLWRARRVRRPSLPLTWDPLSPAALAGLVLATREVPADTPIPQRSLERALEALARGALSLDATVHCEGHTASLGRHLVRACLPPSLAAEALRPWTVRTPDAVLRRVLRATHVAIAARSADALERLGAAVYALRGRAPGLEDLAVPDGFAHRRADLLTQLREVFQSYDEGLITDGERYGKAIDLQSCFVEEARRVAGPHPFAPLCTPRGLTYDAHGSLSETAVLHSVAEGLTPHEAAQRWSAERRAILREDRPPAHVGALLCDLDAALGDLRVVVRDCGTARGVAVSALRLPWYDELVPLRERLFGRYTVEDVLARDGTVLAPAGTLLTDTLAKSLEAAHLPSARVRDPRTCEAVGGLCARCLGLDPDDATIPQVGDRVGARVAFTIARAVRSVRAAGGHLC